MGKQDINQSIAFISTGYFPIPPAKGGAVENLVYALVRENEKKHQFDFYVYTCDSVENVKLIRNIRHTKFIVFSTPHVIQIMDKVLYEVLNFFTKKEKNMSFRYMLQRILFEIRVAWDIRKHDYNKIIVENTAFSFFPLKFFGNQRKYDGKVIYHLHNEVGNTFGCKKQITHAMMVMGISKFVNYKFMERIPEYKGKLEILKNCITEECTEEIIDIRKKYNIDRSNCIILYVGRLSSEKGVLELIKAFKKTHIEKSHLIIAGSAYYNSDVISPYEKILKNEAREIKSHITFTGYIRRNEIISFYNIADIAVFPAMWDEPAGLTIIEAMNEGTAVITTDAGGITEYINEKSAVILKRDEKIIDQIANAINNLKEHPELRNQLAEAGRQCVEKYSCEMYFDSFCRIMEKYR